MREERIEEIKAHIGEIELPRVGKSLQELGLIQSVEIRDAKLSLTVRFNPNYASKSELRDRVEAALETFEELAGVEVTFAPPSQAQDVRRSPTPRHIPTKIQLPEVDRIIAVFSAKGGVGKTTVSVNLAATLANAGRKVGLLDADIHGPNVPNLLGIEGPPRIIGDKILPTEKYGIETMSIGFLIEAEQPLVWRGPMLKKALDQFLTDVAWGKLDYLIIDMPPGTGDQQLNVAQGLDMTGALAVTTPQEVSLSDVRRGIHMFEEVKVPLLGIVENMSYFICPHCGETTEIFGVGGGERESLKRNVPLLGRIPIDPDLRESGDRGVPIVIAAPDSQTAKEFERIASRLADRIKDLKITIPEP
ncbi:MAG: P-loop NTPase [Candidatus Bipolaricaulia bacterium]